MPVLISMLRGVNIGPHKRIKMDALRKVYTDLGLKNACSYIQSGNVIFQTQKRDPDRVARDIEKAIEQEFGFHSDVFIRTAGEMRQVVAGNPFAGREGMEPAKLVVTFLSADPGELAREKVHRFPTDVEEIRLIGREMYIHFPNGQGRSTLNFGLLDKALGVTGTARNWNSVNKLLEMAEELEGC